jgi:hypothetical protein
MSRDFDSNNDSKSSLRFLRRKKYRLFAYGENNGLGEKCIKDFNFVERMRYGHIDNKNNSIIPKEDRLVSIENGRVFDFVADSYSLARLNILAAVNKGHIPSENLTNNLSSVTSYSNPKVRYGEYLNRTLQYYNETHIPNILGTTSITSYEGYVKSFLNFFLENPLSIPLTLTGWNLSNDSSIFNTGLAFSYMNLKFDEDQRKIDEIIDDPNFQYLKNLCTNMGFSISHSNPNILVYDVDSPANKSILGSYGIYNLDYLFKRSFIKTYTLDNDILYNKINIYYNKYVESFSRQRIVEVKDCRTVSRYISLSPVDINKRPYSDLEEISIYANIRNKEEGRVYTPQTLNNIYKKAKYFYKKLDKPSAFGYINDMFRDQVWNKDYGFHDLKAKLEGKTITEAQRQQGGGSLRGRGSSY